ncbi:MAG: hypothetical protein NC306_12580 [Butyrivibrio sp.]|nr:hypothetical protein [Butyrivibrio sp.]
MEKTDVNEVFKEYGLDVEQIETNVYKPLNINNETDVEGLRAGLTNCILITSRRLRSERLEVVFFRGYRGTRHCLARIY